MSTFLMPVSSTDKENETRVFLFCGEEELPNRSYGSGDTSERIPGRRFEAGHLDIGGDP
jgi:hypothetical protein